MSSLPVVLIGAGGHATVIAAALGAIGRPIAGCVGPIPPQPGTLEGVKYLGTDSVLADLDRSRLEVTVTIGSVAASTLRQDIFNSAVRLGLDFATIVHPSAIVDSSVVLGRGAQIMAGAIVQCNSRIGNNVIINTGAIVEHDCVVGSHSHVATGAILTGGVLIGSSSHIGAGATVLQGRKIGDLVTVGAGACVVSDLADKLTAIGVPAEAVSKRFK